MKIIGAILLIANFEGGEPVKVLEYTGDSPWDRCIASMNGMVDDLPKFKAVKAVCVPVYAADP